MQKRIYELDKGNAFGHWNDPVSKLMYIDSIELSFKGIKTSELSVADYGGANGILRDYLDCKKYICIDIDSSKDCDIHENILTHTGHYNLIVIRYVLHYLTDEEITQLLEHITSFHHGDILIIQFTNESDDLRIKKEISKEVEQGVEQKYFRTFSQLLSLFGERNIKYVTQLSYTVTPEFYKNRLGIDTKLSHKEQINNILIKCTQ